MATIVRQLLRLLPVFLLSACASAPRAPGPDVSALRIGVIGDQTYAPDLSAAYETLRVGVGVLIAQHQTEPLDVVLHVGDLVESGEDPAVIQQNFAQATGILNGLPVRWYLTAGDHDVNPPEFGQNSPDRSREELYSGVDVSSEPPLWETRLHVEGTPPNQVGLTFRIEYVPDSPGFNEPLELFRNVAIPVQACP